MRINRLIITTIFGIVLLASCSKQIEFNGKETDPKLVINCLAESGQPVTAYISKSYFFLDDDQNTDAPADLAASLYVNGNHIGELAPSVDTVWNDNYQYGEGDTMYLTYKLMTAYHSDYRPAVGDIVKVTASANGFDNAEGTSNPLPYAADWSLGDYKITAWDIDYYIDEEEDTIWSLVGSLELTVNIRDLSPNQTDYYRLLARFGDYDDYMSDYRLFVYPTYDDPVFGSVDSQLGLFDNGNYEGTFTDLLFDGKNYQIKLPLSMNATFKNRPDTTVRQIPITMQHITKDYYLYLNTCEQDDELMQLLTEPVQTHTNVEGGYGVVGGMTKETLWFTLPWE